LKDLKNKICKRVIFNKYYNIFEKILQYLRHEAESSLVLPLALLLLRTSLQVTGGDTMVVEDVFRIIHDAIPAESATLPA